VAGFARKHRLACVGITGWNASDYAAMSLGDYAQALQAARLPAPRGSDRWSRPSVARVLRYCGKVTAINDQDVVAEKGTLLR